MSGRPLPVIDDLTEPFWAATRERRLVVQQCAACGTAQHPPAPQCLTCLSLELTWRPVSGEGVVESATTMHEGRVAGFVDQVPYTCVAVRLDEADGVLMLGNLVGEFSGTGEQLVGSRVTVDFEPVSDVVTLAQFRLSGDRS